MINRQAQDEMAVLVNFIHLNQMFTFAQVRDESDPQYISNDSQRGFKFTIDKFVTHWLLISNAKWCG